MAKLTLSVDDDVVSAAKRYAQQHGVSVSGIVESYLAALSTRSSSGAQDTPILNYLRGSLKTADLSEYRKHLARKHR